MQCEGDIQVSGLMERASTNPLFLFRRLYRVGVQLNADQLLPNSLSRDCDQEALDEFTSMNIGDTAESESETAVSTRQHPFHSTCNARTVQSRDGTVTSTLMDPSRVCGTTSDVVCPDDPLSNNLGEGTPCSHLGNTTSDDRFQEQESPILSCSITRL